MPETGYALLAEPRRLPASRQRRFCERETARAFLRPERLELGPHDVVDQWGMDSFPASDPPANW
jgi:hypothetical protein